MINSSRTFALLLPLALSPLGPVHAAETMTLDVCPTDYSGFPADGPTLSCGCTPEAMKSGDVFGANPYYWQSSVCRAARHAGILSAQGGQILVTPAAVVPVYPAVSRNNIAGRSYRGGSDNQGFRIAALPGASRSDPVPTMEPAAPRVAMPVPEAPSASTPVKLSTPGLTLDVCPTSYSGFPADGPALTCGCSPEAMKTGDAFGANPFYWQSSICRAALHAGILDASGGQVVVKPSVAAVYPAVKRNGVIGRSYRGGAENQGFDIAPVPGAMSAVPSIQVKAVGNGIGIDVCPNSYSDFSADAPSVSCGCTAAAMKDGDAFGANPYYWQSSVCRAALHAGILDASGGEVIVTPSPVVPVYPAVTRNGVKGRSYAGGADNQGFRIAGMPGALRPVAPAPAAVPIVDGAGQPIQAPVAESLRQSGQVALYIRFRFNSADLDMSGAPTLMQLRDALIATPDLRLVLVGHTDAVGGRDYNRDLSLKRAQAVMLWLRDEGVPAGRLAIDGRGFDEPVADNTTDSGRALNRRVQAIRMP